MILAAGDHRWRRVLELLPHDVYHLPEYVELEARRQGGEAVAVVVREAEDLLMVPLVLRAVPNAEDTLDATSPYGYPGLIARETRDGFVRRALLAVLASLATRGVAGVFVRGHPLLPLTVTDVGQRVDHGETVWIDTQPVETAQWGDYRKTTRNLVRRLRADGFVTREDHTWERLTEFVQLYTETMKRVGASDGYFFSTNYFEELRTQLGGHVSLWVVEREGELACGGLFFRTGPIAQYHLSASDPRWARASPTRLMLDDVRRHVAQVGVKRFHLGGGLGGRSDALFDFKAAFSSRRARFSTWRAVADPRAFARACEAAHVDVPSQLGAYFPPYHRVMEAPP
jgi:hypothetical protein